MADLFSLIFLYNAKESNIINKYDFIMIFDTGSNKLSIFLYTRDLKGVELRHREASHRIALFFSFSPAPSFRLLSRSHSFYE